MGEVLQRQEAAFPWLGEAVKYQLTDTIKVRLIPEHYEEV